LEVWHGEGEVVAGRVAAAAPVLGVETKDGSVEISWNNGTDSGGSGVFEYWWTVDQITDTVPHGAIKGAAPPATINLKPIIQEFIADSSAAIKRVPQMDLVNHGHQV